MGELVITTSDKDLLADINSVAVESVGANKSEATGQKIRRVKAILTTPPVDISTVKDVVEIVAGLTVIAQSSISIAKSMNPNNNKNPEVNTVDIESINIHSAHSSNKHKSEHHDRKSKKKR